MKSAYSFTPESVPGSQYPKYKNVLCYGIDLRSYEDYLTTLNLDWLIDTYKQCVDQDKFFNNFFDKLAGTDKLRKQIIQGKSASEIKASWQKDLKDFQQTRAKYLIY